MEDTHINAMVAATATFLGELTVQLNAKGIFTKAELTSIINTVVARLPPEEGRALRQIFPGG